MENRIAALTSQFPQGADAALILSPVNRFYFTGMHSSAGAFLAFKDGASYFLTDSRYYELARKTVQGGCEVLLQQRLYTQLAELLKRHDAKCVAVEEEYMTLSSFTTYKHALPSVRLLPDVPLSKTIARLRAEKSPEELARIREAQRLTDEAFTHICDYIRPGRTERDIAGELLDFTFRRGSSGPSFEYIVVSGANSSMPHGVPTDKAVCKGEFVTMDFGCIVDGYCSDMTRTVAIGQPDEQMRQVYDTVLQAQRQALQAIRAGVVCMQVDAKARDFISKAGFGDCFGHGTGHSLGIEIHEEPAFNTRDETVLKPGMVLSVEPGIYLEGRFGVRIEDIVAVTADGCENLTASDKNLLCL